ncbi:30S ribosomal protein S7 [bacterium]|nr:30S ribosomal protein S7 [bacterium]
MARKPYKKRKYGLKPDVKYNSLILAKFINVIMVDGKKSIAQDIVYKTLEILEKKLKKPPLEIFDNVMEKARPAVEVKSKRLGGANYQIPIEIKKERSLALTMRWLINFARKRSGHSMIERLTAEMLDILDNKGATIKKKEDTHRMAEANKAFAHYNW